MATELKEGQKLRRQIKVYGIEEPVIVELTYEGLFFKIKGTSVGVGAAWPKYVGAAFTPEKAKSFLAGKPMEFLQHQAAQLVKRREKRIDKKEAQQ
jgi:hypothetical protein